MYYRERIYFEIGSALQIRFSCIKLDRLSSSPNNSLENTFSEELTANVSKI